MTVEQPSPPGYLSRESKAWWRKVAGEYRLEAHGYRLLSLAAGAWDRAEQARVALEAAGSLTYTDRFGAPRPRPEVAIERDARLSFARLLRALDLAEDTPAASPPAWAS
jgi:phage terminase small subunit